MVTSHSRCNLAATFVLPLSRIVWSIHGRVRFALICFVTSTLCASDTILGKVEFGVPEPRAFASSNLTADAVGEALSALVLSSVGVQTMDVAVFLSAGHAEELAGQPEFEVLREQEDRRAMLSTSYSDSVTVMYSMRASPAWAQDAANALHSVAGDALAAEVLRHLTSTGVSGVHDSMRVITKTALCLLYETLGSMGGSTNLTAVPSTGAAQVFEAAPARWNAWQPKAAHRHSVCALARGTPASTIKGLLIGAIPDGISQTARLGQACGAGVSPAPSVGAVLLALRGGCSFLAKVRIAERAGYCGLLVANELPGPPHRSLGLKELPDMTVEPVEADRDVNIPAWLVDERAGRLLLALLVSGGGHVEARDMYRRPALGHGQADEFGLRDHQTH